MSSKETFTPNDEVMTTIVLPTIGFCVGLIVAMLVGINKCKEWEHDKVGEMRRTRRVIQRITDRLREKNFRTIQNARRVRKQAHAASVAASKSKKKDDESPPLYTSAQRNSVTCGRSPPPSYEDALLDEYYNECKPTPSMLRRSWNVHLASIDELSIGSRWTINLVAEGLWCLYEVQRLARWKQDSGDEAPCLHSRLCSWPPLVAQGPTPSPP